MYEKAELIDIFNKCINYDVDWFDINECDLKYVFKKDYIILIITNLHLLDHNYDFLRDTLISLWYNDYILDYDEHKEDDYNVVFEYSILEDENFKKNVINSKIKLRKYGL